MDGRLKEGDSFAILRHNIQVSIYHPPPIRKMDK